MKGWPTRFRLCLAVFAIPAFATLLPFALKADYHLERITGILNQPTYVTQAPGDPTNILYYTTRISAGISGFGATNTMGKVWRYDVSTRVSTPVLDFSARQVRDDMGLQCIAFHPNFNLVGSNGYGKLYVSTAEYDESNPTNRVEEYFLDPANPNVTNGAVFQRLLLRYTGNAQNNHPVGWIGFDPTATNEARQYLYIETADAAYGNAYGGGVFPGGRPSQNPADVRGKILRVDISGANDYPGDTNKNFAIPPSNPIPVYNAAHPGSPIMGSNSVGLAPGLGEVFVSGVRNGYRVSFDRANGDLYFGDVGEITWEEIDFLKAGSNVAGPPVDYGFPQLEGAHNSTTIGSPHSTTNPFTGVVAYYPIREWHHFNGNAAIGGYVYRGPIPELQGKYCYADYVTGDIWLLDFDRNTAPATFNGTNGTITNVTALWNTLLVDATNYNYRGDTNIASLNGIDHVVSFGEDNDGNLYVVDLGYGSNFNGQYTAGAGEIFKVVPGPVPPPTLTGTPGTTNVTFTWSGPLFKLQAQTNSLNPTGWRDYPNGATNPVIVPYNTSQGSVYFRLKSL